MMQGVTVFINNSLKELFKDFSVARPYHFLAVPMMLEAIYKKINKAIDKSGKRKLINLVIVLNKVLLKVGIDIRHILFKQIRESFGGNLQLLVTGGAVANPAIIQGLIDLGFIVLNGYGISECSPIVSVNATYDWKVGTIGKVLKGCEVKIIDDEICVRGDIVMLGYYKNPEATAEVFDGEWFKTGDLGYFDDDGFLYINGRKKTLIILNNGKNVSPEELEVLISNIENVVEVVVYGEDDLIAAEIFAEDRTGIEEGIAKINETLPKYKKINRIKFRDSEFEKTTTKKIKRNYK
jgi:long-chain acyl-CoA synthetase